MTETNKKKQRVIKEDVKDRHTSHWDLDYVSREELEQLMTMKDGSDTEGLMPSDDSSDDSADDISDDSSYDRAANKQIPVPKDQDQ